MTETDLRVDLGCGANKREGFVGLDSVAAPGVDHVLDLTHDRYPFADASVDHVYSSHFLEHIGAPNHVFQEIARICRDGARIEFWTPYALSNDAFLYGHLSLLTEEIWLHFCAKYRDEHLDILGGRWLLEAIRYVVEPDVEQEIRRQGFTLDFAIRHLQNVVREFGVEMTFRRNLDHPVVEPVRAYAHSRFGPWFPLADATNRPGGIDSNNLTAGDWGRRLRAVLVPRLRRAGARAMRIDPGDDQR